MNVIKNSAQARTVIQEHRNSSKTIGLVPTMGALHNGHLSLIEESIRNNDITVATIFVNPIQFNNPDDLKKYPVSIDEDLQALEEMGVDYVFMPQRDEMYPRNPVIDMSFGHLEEVMEGKFRAGHFNGVAIVVAKLFNILSPTRAYFGQKDLQQFKIIEQMVNDLSMAVELKMMPIIREASGLAMSSRNRRLSEIGLKNASQIYRILKRAADALHNGKNSEVVMGRAITEFSNIKEISTEYFELANLEDLSIASADTDINRLVLCFAGYVEGVRLIDNVIVGEKD